MADNEEQKMSTTAVVLLTIFSIILSIFFYLLIIWATGISSICSKDAGFMRWTVNMAVSGYFAPFYLIYRMFNKCN